MNMRIFERPSESLNPRTDAIKTATDRLTEVDISSATLGNLDQLGLMAPLESDLPQQDTDLNLNHSDLSTSGETRESELIDVTAEAATVIEFAAGQETEQERMMRKARETIDGMAA